MYPVLFISFLKLHFGLSLGFLPFWNPKDVYFQVAALNSNHAHKKMGDQGVLLNRLVLHLNYTVKCFSRINLLKHSLTLTSLSEGVCTHCKVSHHGLKTKSCTIFLGLKVPAKPVQNMPWTQFKGTVKVFLLQRVCFFHSWLAHVQRNLKGQWSATKGVSLEKNNQWEAKAAKDVSWGSLASQRVVITLRLPPLFILLSWLY